MNIAFTERTKHLHSIDPGIRIPDRWVRKGFRWMTSKCVEKNGWMGVGWVPVRKSDKIDGM